MANPTMRILILFLTVLAFVSNHSLTAEILQAAFQMPDGDIVAEIPHQTEHDGVIFGEIPHQTDKDGDIFAEIPHQTEQDGVIFAGIPHQIGQDGTPTYESADGLLDLWSHIEEALQFLEHTPTNTVARDKIQDYFRRDKSLERGKTLPLIRHHFIRFGKRSNRS